MWLFSTMRPLNSASTVGGLVLVIFRNFTDVTAWLPLPACHSFKSIAGIRRQLATHASMWTFVWTQ